MNFQGSRAYSDVPCWIRISGDKQSIGISSRNRRIKQKTNDEIVAVYPSAAVASVSSGTCYTSIIKCLNGTQNTAGGFGWSY